MVLSGIIPFGKSADGSWLPAWMYHAQEPPPAHEFNPNLPGLTWVDLVFPAFLFAMGAAIPLALSSRVERGEPAWKLVAGFLLRGCSLAWFAIYFQHIRPYTLATSPTTGIWLTSLLGLALLFPMFSRFPARWKPKLCLGIRALGFAAAAALLARLHYPDGTGFSVERRDIILMVLANMAVFASAIWLFTAKAPLARLGIVAISVALGLASREPGWARSLWSQSPAPWLFEWDFLKYLCVAIPGTLAGDALVEWRDSPRQEELQSPGELKDHSISLGIVSLAIIATALVGLQSRQLWQTTLVEICLTMIACELVRSAGNSRQRLQQSFVRWAAFWVWLGLALEPFEGGIKKDHATLSYLFLTPGLSLFLLAALTALPAAGRQTLWMTNALAEVGQNPMIGYCAMGNFIQPVLALTTMDSRLAEWLPAPWLGVLKALLETFALAVLIRLLTRRRIVWRT